MSSDAQHFDYGTPVNAPVFHPEVYLSAYPHTLNPALISAQMEAATSARLPGQAIAAGLNALPDTIGKAIEDRQRMGNWRTEALAQKIAQQYMQGTGAMNVQIGPEGGVSGAPYGNASTALHGYPAGVVGFGNNQNPNQSPLGHSEPIPSATAPAGADNTSVDPNLRNDGTATGDNARAVQRQSGQPQSQAPAHYSYGAPPSASTIPVNAAVPLALNALAPAVQQPNPSEQSLSLASGTSPQHVAPPQPATGDDVNDWYNDNIAPTRGWYRETNPDGSLGRYVMQHKDKTIPDQPVHPDYFAKYGQAPRTANQSIAASPVSATSATPQVASPVANNPAPSLPGTQQFWNDTLTRIPMPASGPVSTNNPAPPIDPRTPLPQIPNTRDAMPLGSQPYHPVQVPNVPIGSPAPGQPLNVSAPLPQTPQEVIAAGGGLPGLMAASGQSSGIRSTDAVSPYRPGFGPNSSPPAAPVTGPTPQAASPQKDNPRYPTEKGKDDLNDADGVWKNTAGISRDNFAKGIAQGTIRYTPGDQASDPTQRIWTDARGVTYPVYVNPDFKPQTDPPAPGSLYTKIDLSPFEERRFPVIGEPYTYTKTLDATARTRIDNDIQDSGVDPNPQRLSGPALESTWKLAKQLGPVKDPSPETDKQMTALWNALKIVSTEKHLLNSIPPEQRSLPAHWGSQLATNYGPNIPAPVSGAVKWATGWVPGGGLDLKNTNEPLKELEDTHKQLLETIRTYNQESGADIPAGLRDPHDPDAPTAFNQWEHGWFAPHVSASTDLWTSRNYRIPLNFLHQANMSQFGENYPGGYASNPIELLNDAQFHKLKAMNLTPRPWVHDASGLYQLK